MHVSPVTMSPDILRQILPFYVLVDDESVVRSVGSALFKLAGDLLGRPVFEVLRIVKPRRLDPQRALKDGFGERLTVEIPGLFGGGSSRLFGSAFPVNCAGLPGVLIAMTPGVNARSFVQDWGLKLSDFGPADGSADILPLLALQADMLEDSKMKSARLSTARDSAERLANHDVLTGLPNRRALMTHLTEALAGGPVAGAHVDLDKFKEINDTYGHAAGDAALRHAAAAMQEVFGDGALCGRLGGDEFVGLLPGTWTDNDLIDLADRVIARICRPFRIKEEAVMVGASVGLATAAPQDGMTADSILHNADLALYEVKRAGRMNAVVCTPELLAAHSAFQMLSADIRRGLAEHEFLAYLQPQVEACSGTVLGFEALVRWQHPTRGMLQPGQFLEVADRAGHIQLIDAAVRRSALNTLQRWDAGGVRVPKISLNVTMRDLLDPRFCETLLCELDARGVDTTRVMLEIVESVLYDDKATVITQACQRLVHNGFVLALDDFGTGYASILSLVNLPISIVKIDRAFTAGVAQDARKQALARSMVGMASTLGLLVLAEGVEDDADVMVLRDMGCERFQSYHFGRPMAPPDALTWLAGRPVAGFPIAPIRTRLFG
ncbi:MAG: EAL domain-containing protein [Candidatus Saccharibacteria bacterium]|nr:EAL domain-containing protein [Pseudorhodobacter sp.]